LSISLFSLFVDLLSLLSIKMLKLYSEKHHVYYRLLNFILQL